MIVAKFSFIVFESQPFLEFVEANVWNVKPE